MNRFANLADKSTRGGKAVTENEGSGAPVVSSTTGSAATPVPPSRVGRKAIAAYFSPEMSFAMHFCARKHGLSLQELMAEAFDDILRKYGESPIGG